MCKVFEAPQEPENSQRVLFENGVNVQRSRGLMEGKQVEGGTHTGRGSQRASEMVKGNFIFLIVLRGNVQLNWHLSLGT